MKYLGAGVVSLILGFMAASIYPHDEWRPIAVSLISYFGLTTMMIKE